MNTDAKILKMVANRFQQYTEGLYIMMKWDLFLEYKDDLTNKNKSV